MRLAGYRGGLLALLECGSLPSASTSSSQATIAVVVSAPVVLLARPLGCAVGLTGLGAVILAASR